MTHKNRNLFLIAAVSSLIGSQSYCSANLNEAIEASIKTTEDYLCVAPATDSKVSVDQETEDVLQQAQSYTRSWSWIKLPIVTLPDSKDVNFGTALSALFLVPATFGRMAYNCNPDTCTEESLLGLGLAAGSVAVVYALLQSISTSTYYQNALNYVQRIHLVLKNDPIYKNELKPEAIDGYFLARFGGDTGVVNAVKHYQNLYAQVESAKEFLQKALQTRESELRSYARKLNHIVSTISSNLIKVLNVIYAKKKADYKEQLDKLERKHKEQIEREAKERKDARDASERTFDKVAAVVTGPGVRYTRIAA